MFRFYQNTAKTSISQSWSELQAVAKPINTANSIQVLLVKINGQVYSLLMSQLFNILKVTSDEPHFTKQTKLNGKPCTVVEYRSQFVPVISLAKVLLMPEVTPLEQSEILLSGKLTTSNTLAQVYGLCVDTVLTVHISKLEDLRSLPSWLYQKNLGKILIGALLVEPQIINPESEELGVIQHDITPVKNLLFDEDSAKLDRKAELYYRYTVNSQQKIEQDNRRPIMLLNLDAIRSQLYGE
jgi:chemotaxis signal transduction protein